MTISTTDTKAREKAVKILREKFGILAKRIIEGKKPVLILPKRVLSNTIYDVKKKLLLLGPEMQKRSLLDVNEARKFMQTLLMASIIYEALVNDEYPTIRDLYYRGKHTITYRDPHGRLHHENTWDEQRESDSVIRDIEVYLGLLREEMLILSKEKGKVVGNLVIKSGDDIIDLSKMGHGAYSIEPTPDLIEFRDVDAEYVLVVEKDAVFQQLHRYGFWKKHKAILITSAGQPDRATRRFVRRLNEELKLPIYILTDSIPADEVVIIRDRRTGRTSIGPIEELIGGYFDDSRDKERVFLDIDVPSWDPVTNRILWRRVGYVYRHKIHDKILNIKTRERGVIRVTKAHSLFVFRDGKIEAIPAKDVKPGDYIIVATKLPKLPIHNKQSEINLLEIAGGETIVEDTVEHMQTGMQYTMLLRSNRMMSTDMVLDEELAWLSGLFISKGSSYGERYIVFSLDPQEADKAEKITEIIKRKFNVKPNIIYEPDGQIRIHVDSKPLYIVFNALGLTRPLHMRRVPDVVINSTPVVIMSFIKGLLEGGSYIDEYGDIIYSTRNIILAKQVFNLLLSLSIQPSLMVNGDNYIIRIEKSHVKIPPKLYKYLTSNELGESSYSRISSEPMYNIPVDDKTLYNYDELVKNDAALVEVIEVYEEEYNGYVYDFAVPDTNSFVGSYGIVYHNSDPYGWYIYSVFKIGSITLSYESERLATPDAKFIGVMMTDVFGSDIIKDKLSKIKIKDIVEINSKILRSLPKKKPYLSEKERRNFLIKAKPKDVERAVELVGYEVADICLDNKDMRDRIRRKKEGLAGYPWFRTPQWIRELCIFFKTLAKLEIEAMASKGLRFLADEYIPKKIETGDWID